MKLIFTVTALFLAVFAPLIYSAAVDTSLVARGTDVTTSTPYGDVVAYELADGRRKLDFYANGVLEGSAVENGDGATFYDEKGEEIDINDESLEKRQSKLRLAIRFAKMIAKWGKRAWDYIYCVGASSMWSTSNVPAAASHHGNASTGSFVSGLLLGDVKASSLFAVLSKGDKEARAKRDE
ncbi:hypothetical protein MMC24_006873 [Lignoscripta atroalba]|nr:hypothetical protein [Lignoscripta atroalba]